MRYIAAAAGMRDGTGMQYVAAAAGIWHVAAARLYGLQSIPEPCKKSA